MKKLTNIVLALCLAIGMFVGLPQTVVTTEAATVKLNKTKLTLGVSESYTLKLKGTKKKATWSSSNKKVATVKSGEVTAKKKGTAKITAKVGKKKYTCKVTVTKATLNFGFEASDLPLQPSTDGAGMIFLVDTNCSKIKVSSSNEKILHVGAQAMGDEYKIVTVWGIKAGTANIIITAGDRKETIPCKVKKGTQLIKHDEFSLSAEEAAKQELGTYTNFIDWQINEYKNTKKICYCEFDTQDDISAERNRGITIGSTWDEVMSSSAYKNATSMNDTWKNEPAIFTAEYIDSETGLHFTKVFVYESDGSGNQTVKKIIWNCYIPAKSA
jgi:hypothetical protein